MKKTTLFKVVFVVCLMIAGFGVAKPAGAYIYPPCSEGYCAPPNQSCLCECVEGDGETYRCDKAPPICFA